MSIPKHIQGKQPELPTTYALPRDQVESARLNLQHQTYVKNIGYLLHPEIVAALPSTARVADVGTGTGVWLQDLARNCPATWSLTGLDMSDSQFPKTHDGRCEYQVLNILDPVPAELRKKFDLVHIRLLISGLAGEEWSTACRNAFSVLRPGGYIQWTESDFPRLQILQLTSGASITACQKEIAEFKAGHQRYGKFLDDVPRLLETMHTSGFETCERDVFSSDRDPNLRMVTNEFGMGALHRILGLMLARDPQFPWNREQLDTLVENVKLELAGGRIYINIGRRPLS